MAGSGYVFSYVYGCFIILNKDKGGYFVDRARLHQYWQPNKGPGFCRSQGLR